MTAQKKLPYQIKGREIGPEHPPYIIAEMSGNHNGSLERALRLIDAAVDAGADAVKLQTYTADTITLDCDGPEFQIEGGLWHGRKLHDLYQEAHTPWDWHPKLFDHARARGITIFSSPFDPTAVSFLESLAAPAYKIASFEAVDLPLVEIVAKTGKPMIISTGLADLGEISAAVETARKVSNHNIVVLHCISGYPTPAADCNLACIRHMGETFDVIPGFSDHTLGIAVPLAAVAMGACVIEKHFTLSRGDGGPDAAFSLEPDELKAMVQGCRDVFAARGQIDYSRKGSEKANAKFRRSLYVTRDLQAGDMLTADNVRSVRPGYGLPPKYLPEVLGKQARDPLPKGTALQWSMIK